MTKRSEIVRWTASCVTVVICYAAAATAILAWEPHYEVPTAPMAIAMIDLAPLPPEPTPPPPPAPPPPPEPEIVPEPPPEVKVEVPLPPVKKPPPPKLKREEPPPQEVPPTPSPPIETAAVPTPAPAPRIAARPDPSPNILAAYTSRIQMHVQNNLRYPLAALRRNERGTAFVVLTVNRDGRILSHKLETGTNRRLLDEEAIAVVMRSNPMPPIPPEIERSEMELRIPIAFSIR